MARHGFTIAPPHHPELRDLGLSELASCLAFQDGETIKSEIPGRDVVRIERKEGWYFLKRVRGRGWREILHEHAVLERLRSSGLPVPEPVACGAEGTTAAMVTVGLPTARTLEAALLSGDLAPDRLRSLTLDLATLLRSLHDLGINHRDFYAGHIHLGPDDRLYLVDFGRAEIRDRVPRRRVIKDLAALHFSVPARVLGTTPRLRFLLAYVNGRASRSQIRKIARQVDAKSQRMRSHSLNKLARGEPNVHVNQ